jgi:hypothetical protein
MTIAPPLINEDRAFNKECSPFLRDLHVMGAETELEPELGCSPFLQDLRVTGVESELEPELDRVISVDEDNTPR